MIKKIIPFIAIVLLFFSCNSQIDQEKLIEICFKEYKTAILNGNGKKAATCVDSRTINYYNEMLNETIYGDSLSIDSLSLVDKVMILSIRHRTPKSQILEFDGKSLFVHAIESGMIGKNSVIKSDIGEIYIDDDFAAAKFIANGEPTAFNYHFYKEGDWKLDLTAMLKIGNTAMKKMSEKSGKSENEFLFELLEIVSNKKPNSALWQPLD